MEIHDLAHSPAAERNTPPILEFFKEHLKESSGHFLEIGFGTGQHAFAFSKAYPSMTFYTSDQLPYHYHLNKRIEVLGRPKNLKGPYELIAKVDKVKHNLEEQKFNTIFSANTLHIMSWPEAVSLLNFLPSLLEKGGQLFFYGPFKFEGEFTSESNQSFDLSLKSQAEHMGIRDYEKIYEILGEKGVIGNLVTQMPANNHILSFTKK
jgi:hypothetical protein